VAAELPPHATPRDLELQVVVWQAGYPPRRDLLRIPIDR
jgi:hypothetical protein